MDALDLLTNVKPYMWPAKEKMKITRRDLLATTSTLAAGFMLGAKPSQATTSAQTPQTAPPTKIKVIVCGGHPGDPEYGCGGTIAKLTQLGHDITLLYLNNGAWETSAEIRIAEAKRACEILKAHPSFAGQANGHAIVD